jgi:hypothetical protein
MGGLMLLAGCNEGGDKAPGIPVNKWKGAAYHTSFDKPPAKPNAAGITIPAVKFTANPEALVKRAAVVVRFDTSAAPKKLQDRSIINQVVLAPVDISGEEGAFPVDYMNFMDQEVAKLLDMSCVSGKVKLTVAMARSSLNSRPADTEIEDKRLSDWLPIELVFKNPHPGKC